MSTSANMSDGWFDVKKPKPIESLKLVRVSQIPQTEKSKHQLIRVRISIPPAALKELLWMNGDRVSLAVNPQTRRVMMKRSEDGWALSFYGTRGSNSAGICITVRDDVSRVLVPSNGAEKIDVPYVIENGVLSFTVP